MGIKYRENSDGEQRRVDLASQEAPQCLQTIQDVIALIEEQVEAIRAEPSAGTVEKARTIAHLTRIAARAIETGKLAARLEMLELVLKGRQEETHA
jgi:hypothetical protein